VEDELNELDWLAEEAVVICIGVPVTVTVVPDAVFVTLMMLIRHRRPQR
jgi:hypothetical protein